MEHDHRKSLYDVAYEICFGKNRWGDGRERYLNLKKDGYTDYEINKIHNIIKLTII